MGTPYTDQICSWTTSYYRYKIFLIINTESPIFHILLKDHFSRIMQLWQLFSFLDNRSPLLITDFTNLQQLDNINYKLNRWCDKTGNFTCFYIKIKQSFFIPAECMLRLVSVFLGIFCCWKLPIVLKNEIILFMKSQFNWARKT